jgi:ABC-2 type transport system ATP-binding protein
MNRMKEAGMEWVIDTQGLSKTYRGVNALKSLNLRVAPNSIFGFLGPNGAGKTTTIKLLLGLIRPTAGSARIFGLEAVSDSVAIRSRIGYLPQEPRFYEYMTARQILDYTAHFFFKGPQNEIDARVAETLELVGLDDKADRPIKGFSGGERQRLGIAQAQVNYPDLLILDEPAASLDPMGRRDVLEVMGRLRKYTTIFYCTHILDDVQRVSDTVAILNHGELVAYGSVESLLAGSEGLAYEVRLKGNPAGLKSKYAPNPGCAAYNPNRTTVQRSGS